MCNRAQANSKKNAKVTLRNATVKIRTQVPLNATVTLRTTRTLSSSG